MYYIEKGLGRRRLAGLFALLCVLTSFGIGNMTQVNAVSASLYSSFGVSVWVSGVCVALVVALVVWGGVKRIARVTEMVIPFISVFYIGFCGAFLWINRGDIAGTFRLILGEAFSLQPAAGGIFGYGVARAMRFGLSRGVFTNEAGLGSASIAHAAADCKSPAHQGVWGVFEVFLDTIAVCTLTALVILIARDGALWQSGLNGAALTSAAFESVFGAVGGRFVALSILFFAVSGMLGWYYYGETSLRYLALRSRAAIPVYRLLYLILIVAGATGELGFIWGVSDTLNALMAIPNICAVFALRKIVFREGRIVAGK
jgi:AGCS family alanine or glycine:cation symporter